ncbi:N-acetylmuramoyl-L-alanine amidase [Fibrobacter sp. UWB15]|uniref:N-acetylmuramoyl-L-alanine amidase family protein n=1 Tax=unclassified Fibrobacter TaxID=2634177 RepID=UPI000912CDA1|nr:MULTISPECIES: N-acetylmuramoyl-L-alanine amidase [unclassified Fibrobacter]PWJ61781.1 N-acetylmuramoyl-L-alanine amidase [Fibrobacter sp. UWB6]SHG60014.1 N-acetylmuramoyl-L-alanine amidase [Fibrobacter sp. UWB8]SMG43006.1 N-acetylmuramoyl-L-alanine amidase [Fibrobacter sp. UWB15]
MKVFVWHILVCFALAVSAWAANTVDAEQVAKEHKASFHWFPVQKTFILAGETDTVKFAIGLPYVSSHGKSVDLKHAPEIADGHILLDSADVASLYGVENVQAAAAVPASSSSFVKVSSSSAKVAAAAVPVTATKPKNETAGTREVKTIVIDPGHGGKDTGAQGKNSNEKDIVLAVGKLLKKELEKEGFNVKMTRDKDVFIELGERANLANQWDGDLFISLHCNAIDASPERKKQIKGYHVYVLRAPESEEDKAIARRENKVATLYGEKNAKEELSPLEWFKLEARLEKYKQNSYMFTEQMLKAFDDGKIKRQGGGVGGAGFMVLVGALMPAVLFEIGFISNPEEEAYMMTNKAQADIAERISKAVSAYKNAVHNYRETLGRQ